MILQALNEYYQRLREGPECEVPEFGFGLQGVHFCLTLDQAGTLVGSPMDLRDEKGRPKRIEVPGPVGRSSGVASNFAWDNTGYVLGADPKGKPERTAQTHQAFKDMACQLLDGKDDEGAQALLAFLTRWNPEEAAALPDWEEMAGWNIVFRLDGERGFLHERPTFRRAWTDYLANHGPEEMGMCLVTGASEAPIPLTHAMIKGVPGGQTSGAALVSFNAPAFESFGKGKGNLNAPVSEQAAFAYTTALNYLLRPGSDRKLQLGDTTVLFWTDAPKEAVEAEAMFGMTMGGPDIEDGKQVQRLEALLKEVVRGGMPPALGDPDTRFYVLGLSPNAARLSVRLWHVSTVGDMAANLAAHYQALALQRNYDNEPEYPSPWQLLRELAPQRDSRNMSPLLSGQFVRAVIQNREYPRSLLAAAIGRIRADKEINYLRTALLKAYLVRNIKIGQEITMALNKEVTDIGYRLGRLFAIIENIQENAVPGANATVKDRFYGSASATPARIFPIILRNAQHGLGKIRKDKPGLATNAEKAIQEIMDGIDPVKGLPASMKLEEQAMFALGYYQQRKAIFTKKDKNTED